MWHNASQHPPNINMTWDAVNLEYNQKRKYEPVEMCSQEAVTVSLPESQPHEYDGWGGNADVQASGKFLASDETNLSMFRVGGDCVLALSELLIKNSGRSNIINSYSKIDKM
jgi:hypothetical protein